MHKEENEWPKFTDQNKNQTRDDDTTSNHGYNHTMPISSKSRKEKVLASNNVRVLLLLGASGKQLFSKTEQTDA